MAEQKIDGAALGGAAKRRVGKCIPLLQAAIDERAALLELGRVGGTHGVVFEIAGARTARRSKEHTSELQSLMRISYAVLRLNTKIRITTPLHNHAYQIPF